jgi:hypothetical protein
MAAALLLLGLAAAPAFAATAAQPAPALLPQVAQADPTGSETNAAPSVGHDDNGTDRNMHDGAFGHDGGRHGDHGHDGGHGGGRR